MLAQFSVRKPYTVIVAVVIVIILGSVAFNSMTTDLLPSFDLPYLVVATPYPGATPEQVELNVTKPLEQILASTNGVKNITSTSSENYSMIVMEFNNDVNMDSVIIEMSSQLDMAESNWDDTIGAPMIVRINPDAMPIMIAAVDQNGEDIRGITQITENIVVPGLESVDGVASVEPSGLYEESIRVVLDNDKVAKVNEDIKEKILDGLTEAQNAIEEAESALNEGQNALAEQSRLQTKEVESASMQMTAGQIAMAQTESELNSAQTQLTTIKTALETALTQTNAQIEQLTTNKAQLEALFEQLAAAVAIPSVEPSLEPDTPASPDIAESTDVTASPDAVASPNPATSADAVTSPESAASNDAGASPEAQQPASASIEPSQSPSINIPEGAIPEIPIENISNIPTENLPDIPTENLPSIPSDLPVNNVTDAVSGLLPEISTTLPEGSGELEGLTLDEIISQITIIDDSLTQLNNAKAEIEQNIAGIDAQLAQVEQGKAALQSAKEQLNSGQEQLAEGKGMLTEGINSGVIEVASGKAILETKKDDFNSAKETAEDSADVSGFITPALISQLIAAQNFEMPAGTITQDNVDYIVKVGEEIHSVDALENMVLFDLGMEDVEPIRLKDVADVEAVNNADDVYAIINNNQGIILMLQKQSMYSTSQVSHGLNERIATLEQNNPGMHITVLMDQGVYIDVIIDNVLQNLLYGAVLAIIVLLIFLRSIRPTLIIATSIPISVVFALVLMYFSGVTLNIISLAGLALGVGMLVDNSIVVIENIFRMKALGVSPKKAAIEGAKQVSGAIVASTLTTVCVFLPIVFVQGISRDLFSDMGLTIAYSLFASLLVALTLVPSMSAALMKSDKSDKSADRENKDSAVKKAYGKALEWALKYKAIILITVFALFGWCIYSIFSMGVEFMPEMDSDQMTATLRMPDDHSTFEETTQMANEVMERIMSVEGVQTVGGIEGEVDMMGGGSTSDGSATFYILLNEEREITSQEAAIKMREMMTDLDCEVNISDNMMDFSALTGEGISVEIKGQNLDELQRIAKEVAIILKDTPGTAEVSDGLEDAEPELRIIIDRDKAAENGLTVAQIYTEIASKISSGMTATEIDIENFDYPVVVVDGVGEGLNKDNILNIEIRAEDRMGEVHNVKLSNIGHIEEAQSLMSISHDNQTRVITATAHIEPGYNVGLVSRDFSSRLSGYEVPDGYSISVEGENETIMESLDDLIYMLLLALALIYLIMVAQFQSLLSPFIVMFTIPLAFTGGILALLITGLDISVIAMLGFLMLAGIIVNNGIVFIDYTNQLRRSGMEKREALITAGKTRLRPIMMTALTTILGLLTMALGVGKGADMLQPMAVVTISGLLYGTMLTLFIAPIMYDILNRKPLKAEDYEEDDEKLLESAK